MIKRTWFFLLLVLLAVITLPRVQGSANSEPVNVPSPYAGLHAELFANTTGGKADGDILKMYFDLSSLTLQNMKASFRKASSTDKSNLWRTHLALFLVKRPELTKSQQEVILAAISLATPEYFESRFTDSSGQAKKEQALRTLEERILASFSLIDRTKIFATLGDDKESGNDVAGFYSCSGSQILDYNPFTSSSFAQEKPKVPGEDKDKKKDPSPDKGKEIPGQDKGKDKNSEPEHECGCSTDSDFCALWTACASGKCRETQSGCGFLWSYRCNGLCR
jgi:hypothetical protein